jgi:hypothetical protein
VRRSRFIGVGVGIGIGIDSPDAIVSGLLSDCVPTLAKHHQHGDDTVEKLLGPGVHLGRHGIANFKNILHRTAFQSRPSGHLEEPAPLSIGRLAAAFRNVQGVNIQLLMPETHDCPFDTDSDPDPESYDIHAGSG